VVVGSEVNRRTDGRVGFDAFCANLQTVSFALCDGANSCKDSGIAANWLAKEITGYPATVFDPIGYEKHVLELHSQMRKEFPNTGSTLVWVNAVGHKLALLSVGDSSVQVFRRWVFDIGPWREVLKMPRDLDLMSNPTQLVGSEVLTKVNVTELFFEGPQLILMMSDGPADSVKQEELRRILSYVRREEPSTYDLDFMCQQIVCSAFKSGCSDDASAALIWLDGR